MKLIIRVIDYDWERKWVRQVAYELPANYAAIDFEPVKNNDAGNLGSAERLISRSA